LLTVLREICTDCLRELHYLPHPPTQWEDIGAGSLGHSWPGRVRSSSTSIISRDRHSIRVLRHRLPQFPRERYRQGRYIAHNTDRLSTDLCQWYPEVLHFCPYTPLVLVGLKSDLRTKRTCIDLLKTQGLTPVTQEQGMAVAQKMGARYMECSSKEMTGVDDIFNQAINTVVENDPSNQQRQSEGLPPGQSGGMRKKKRTCRFL
jgi:hypothetical protein